MQQKVNQRLQLSFSLWACDRMVPHGKAAIREQWVHGWEKNMEVNKNNCGFEGVLYPILFRKTVERSAPVSHKERVQGDCEANNIPRISRTNSHWSRSASDRVDIDITNIQEHWVLSRSARICLMRSKLWFPQAHWVQVTTNALRENNRKREIYIGHFVYTHNARIEA